MNMNKWNGFDISVCSGTNIIYAASSDIKLMTAPCNNL